MSQPTPPGGGGYAATLVGQVLGGSYRLVDLIGTGGFADVYLARDLHSNAAVAVKVLHPHIARDPTLARRFAMEFEVARRLTGPNVARAIDSGEDPGSPPYLVMEYVQGLSLAEIVRRQGRMSIPESMNLLDQALVALGEAHAHGIVHRDIKPENLMRTSDGVLKVMDFGIARVLDHATMTAVGQRLGTPAYMAPEQIAGQPVDHRVDIYAMGIVLYELLAGQAPFSTSRDPIETMARVRNEPPRPLRSLRPEVPPMVARAVERALEKTPERRFQSVGEMRAALAQAVGAQTPPRSPTPAPPNPTPAYPTGAPTYPATPPAYPTSYPQPQAPYAPQPGGRVPSPPTGAFPPPPPGGYPGAAPASSPSIDPRIVVPAIAAVVILALLGGSLLMVRTIWPSASATPTPTQVAVVAPTSVAKAETTVAPSVAPSATSAPAPSATPVPPSATPVPPSATPAPPSATPVPPTQTPAPGTPTAVPPTATSVLAQFITGSDFQRGTGPVPTVTLPDAAAFFTNGQYVIKQTAPIIDKWFVNVLNSQGNAGVLGDGALTVTAHFTSQPDGGFQPAGRYIELACRKQAADKFFGYRFQLEVGQGRFRLSKMYDGVPDEEEWHDSNWIKPRDGVNKIELRCVGSLISAAVNDHTVVTWNERSYTEGYWSIAAGTLVAGTFDARFDNLELRAP